MENRRSSDRIRNRKVAKISGNSVSNNGVSSAEAAVPRKPLSDVINFDLIPTQTLRKLCSNSLSPSEVQSIIRKSQVPNLQLPPISTTRVVPDSDSRSATSIGSSNFDVAPNTQPRDPILVSCPSSSSKVLKPTGDKGSEIIISGHARVVENKRPRKTDVSPCTFMVSKKTKSQAKTTSILTPSEKVKDKEEGLATQFDSTPTENLRDKPPEKARDKEKGIATPFHVTPTGNVRDRPPENAKAKGKGIAPFISTPARDNPPENARDKGKGIATPFNLNATGDVRDKQRGNSVHFSSPALEKTFDKGKAVHVPRTSTLGEKGTDKEKVIAFEELEDDTPLVRYSRSSKRTKENRREAVVHSCPPREMRNIGKELDQHGGSSASKSWTDPRPKAKKTKYSKQQPVSGWSLPEDYVKAQNAYFAEIDAFELPVETESDSD